jgi:hypothetical protein
LGRAGKEELIHLLQQELPRTGFPEVERVVIDQLLLELEPLRPAYRTDLVENPLTSGGRKGRKGLLVASLAAADAADRWHWNNVNYEQ